STVLSATVSGGETVDWFTISCGGTAVPGGATPTVSPASTTTYFARARNLTTGCVSASCASITITRQTGSPGDLNHDGPVDGGDAAVQRRGDAGTRLHHVGGGGEVGRGELDAAGLGHGGQIGGQRRWKAKVHFAGEGANLDRLAGRESCHADERSAGVRRE